MKEPDPNSFILIPEIPMKVDCASKVSLSLLFYICIYCFYLGFL
jgi:hypothetical protein